MHQPIPRIFRRGPLLFSDFYASTETPLIRSRTIILFRFFDFDFKLYSTFIDLLGFKVLDFINVFHDSQIYMESMHLLYNNNNNNTFYTTTTSFIPDTFSIFPAVRHSIREMGGCLWESFVVHIRKSSI